MLSTVITAMFGFATAGLILSTLLTFVTGGVILDTALADSTSVSPIIQQSKLMQVLIFNQDLWYSLPAILILGVGLLSSE